MAEKTIRSINDVLKDNNMKNLADAERSIRHKNAKKFVKIFLNSNLSMKRAITREDSKILIRKMMLILSIKDVNKTNEKDEATKALLEAVKTVINNKQNNEATNKKDTESTDMDVDNEINSKSKGDDKDKSDETEPKKKDIDTTKNPGEAVTALLASSNPRQPRRTTNNSQADLPFKYKFECRFELISMSEQDRIEELRQKYDQIIEILRKGGVQARFLPLNDADGKSIAQLSSQRGKVTFAGDTDESLPNFSAYGSGWLAKRQWMAVTATLHIGCNVGIMELYMKKAKNLLKKNITMSPRRINMRFEGNFPVAVVLPSFASIDAKGLSFYFLEKHNLYITFELIKVVDGKWVQCDFNDDLCIGFAIIARGDDVSETIKQIKLEWPFSGRRQDSYPLGFRMAAFPLDHTLNIHKRARDLAAKEKKDILLSMHADYQHSRTKVIAGGGAIYMKFLASVESCSIPIVTTKGTTTNLREIITSFKDKVTGKPLIANISPMPSREDAGSVYTNFTTHRAANDEMTEGIAKRAEEFVRNELASKIWGIIPPQEARRVLAASICGVLAMAESVTLEDVADNMPIFPMEGVEIPELDDNSVRSEYANESTSSGITMDSNKTTNSTREKLVETQDERDKLEEQNQELQNDINNQKEQMEKIIGILQNQQLDDVSSKMIANMMAKKEATIIDVSPAKRKEAPQESDDEIMESQTIATTTEEYINAETTTTPTRIKRTAMKTTNSSTFSTGNRRSLRQKSQSSLVILDDDDETRGTSNEMAVGIG